MAFGIDFGTTNSYLASFQNGQTEAFPGVPSEIEGQEEVFRSIKRYLGRRPEELDELGLEYLLRDRGVWLFWEGRSVSPEEMAAMVFQKIQARTVGHIGSAVVAVPAHYDDAQRQATRVAAERAGISVRRLVHEPTAAALAAKKEDRVLVFDLGGGTLDISLLEIQDDLFEVIRTSGDRNLGGDDLDLIIASWFSSRLGLPFSRQLLRAAQEAKHALSASDLARASIDGSPEITREEVELVARPFLERILSALEDFGDASPDSLLLVGGMSRMPSVRKLVEDFFQISSTPVGDPETAVARGAAIYAASLLGEDDSLLVDVTPLSLGIEVHGQSFSTVVPAGSTIPLTAEKAFTTSRDNQILVDVNILQGGSSNPEENRLLGTMRLLGIPPAPAGVPEIWVSFQIDESGILHAWAEHEDGLREEITIGDRAFQNTDPDNE